ncbi:hypothetical protein RFI_33302, partial [Reticulomyxa filosa]
MHMAHCNYSFVRIEVTEKGFLGSKKEITLKLTQEGIYYSNERNKTERFDGWDAIKTCYCDDDKNIVIQLHPVNNPKSDVGTGEYKYGAHQAQLIEQNIKTRLATIKSVRNDAKKDELSDSFQKKLLQKHIKS